MDTPGIGGTGDVTPKLLEYLPNAVSFIFVINIDSAGGMQSDRVCIHIFSGVIDQTKGHGITHIKFKSLKYAK